MQTATNYIFEQLEEQGLIFLITKTNEMTISISASDYLDIKRLAKEMEREQHSKTWDAALSKYEVRAGNYMRAYEDFDDYYNETYKSK